MKTTVWILTKEYNAYDQYGEYFVAVFKKHPSVEQLSELPELSDVWLEELQHIQRGGGRVRYEDVWYNLNEEELI